MNPPDLLPFAAFGATGPHMKPSSTASSSPRLPTAVYSTRGFASVAVAIRKRRADGRRFGIWYRKVTSKMIVYLICVAASGSAGCAG